MMHFKNMKSALKCGKNQYIYDNAEWCGHKGI